MPVADFGSASTIRGDLLAAMRVVLLQFTKAGWAMSAQAAKDFEELEADLRQYLGARDLDELKRLLSVPWDIEEKAAAAVPVQQP